MGECSTFHFQFPKSLMITENYSHWYVATWLIKEKEYTFRQMSWIFITQLDDIPEVVLFQVRNKWINIAFGVDVIV